MKKIVGHVTEEEKKAIMQLNNHKNSLEELLLCLSPDNELYEKARRDLDDTKAKYQLWWDQNYEKYHWEKGISDWTIVFDKNEILIEI